MSIVEWVLCGLFIAAMVAAAIGQFFMGFLVLWAFYKGLFLVLGAKGPKRGQ